MKKTVLALAVLGAFAGAASAQSSSVTLYGRAEVFIAAEQTGDLNGSSGAGETIYRLRDGATGAGKGGSRWGLRGVEDLGGGLSAFFVLESGFDLDTGASRQGNRLFGRGAWVGLRSASLGSVQIGRQDTFSRLVMSQIDPANNGQIKVNDNIGVSGAGNPFGSAATAGAPRTIQIWDEFRSWDDDMVRYDAPKLGGLQLSAMVGAGEGPTRARYQGIMAIYTGGPFGASLSYEAYDGFDETYNKTVTFGGNYNLGFAKVFAGLQRTTDAGTRTEIYTSSATTGAFNDRSGYLVGVDIPLGKANLKMSYVKSDFERDGANFGGVFAGQNEVDLSKFGAVLEYNISKRTGVYTGFNIHSGDLSDYVSIDREFTIFGLWHSF